MYVSIYSCLFVCTYLHMCLREYVCIYVIKYCIYILTYVYTYIRGFYKILAVRLFHVAKACSHYVGSGVCCVHVCMLIHTYIQTYVLAYRQYIPSFIDTDIHIHTYTLTSICTSIIIMTSFVYNIITYKCISIYMYILFYLCG